jgi:hypothetical protein
MTFTLSPSKNTIIGNMNSSNEYANEWKYVNLLYNKLTTNIKINTLMSI